MTFSRHRRRRREVNGPIEKMRLTRPLVAASGLFLRREDKEREQPGRREEKARVLETRWRWGMLCL